MGRGEGGKAEGGREEDEGAMVCLYSSPDSLLRNLFPRSCGRGLKRVDLSMVSGVGGLGR